jgi:alpha-glucosidase (family GH31 glycosyl hydrolase)
VKRALELRYSLLAYFYTLFHEANAKGVPVARPMFFDFHTDNQTWTLDEQFMIGPALMARPAFYTGAVNVLVYFPKENTSWYHFIGGHKAYNGTGGRSITVTSLKNELVLLLRGGFIVPYQVRWPMVSRSQFVTVTRVLDGTDTLRKTGRTLVWGSHRPLHGVAKVTSSVANDETGFKVLTLKHQSECSKVNRQPIGKRETKFKE